ncbi:MAG TPA: hypothetical protein VFD73_15095, partial [Gemmatimonadales bacterium]|nr:hypothetical protein [Gemmatimonadales bacterium]
MQRRRRQHSHWGSLTAGLALSVTLLAAVCSSAVAQQPDTVVVDSNRVRKLPEITVTRAPEP